MYFLPEDWYKCPKGCLWDRGVHDHGVRMCERLHGLFHFTFEVFWTCKVFSSRSAQFVLHLRWCTASKRCKLWCKVGYFELAHQDLWHCQKCEKGWVWNKINIDKANKSDQVSMFRRFQEKMNEWGVLFRCIFVDFKTAVAIRNFQKGTFHRLLVSRKLDM